ncbi:hypothetical protein BJV82DRAFT_665943 [Fennellomyces sp. T-0311]|nr:hypothetical protein BJV82DRAFT_665943 [Fennellomyces sp. T-0311]
MDYPVDVGILVSYFVLIGGLLWRIHGPLQQCFRSKQSGTAIFIAGAFGAFLCTWYYMIKYFVHSYNEWDNDSSVPASLNRISHWLHSVSLFDDAWRTVSSGSLPWLWSHQLCSFTVGVWTPFLAIEGARRRIPYLWAFMLLGQVVAISTSSALFFAVVLAFPRSDLVGPSRFLNNTLLLCIAGGMVTVVLSPFVAESKWFMPNLLVMHLLLVFPLLPSKPAVYRYTEQAIFVTGIYMLSAGASLAIYVHQVASYLFATNSSVTEVVVAMIETFFSHPAQSSISSDVLWVNILCMMWMAVDTLAKNGAISLNIWVLLATTPILSATVTMPVFLALSELNALSTKRNA